MNLRERQELLEYDILCENASKSAESAGRNRFEEKCDIRTDFQRDRDRIIHSNAFRRLKHKTQVFIAPEDDYYRTRLTHTLEVSQIARTISRALRLNEDLTEAIALGHDLGHTPFGHAGEAVLNRLCSFGFAHNKQSIRVVDVIEKDGQGLNLTAEVLDGIENHRLSCSPFTMEGQVVRIADKIAYINHDIDDALRSGILKDSDIPEDIAKNIGRSTSRRIDSMIRDVIFESDDKTIKNSLEMAEILARLREFMFKKVYFGERVNEKVLKVRDIIEGLFSYYMKYPERMGASFKAKLGRESCEVIVCDYIAFMTDDFAMKRYEYIKEEGI